MCIDEELLLKSHENPGTIGALPFSQAWHISRFMAGPKSSPTGLISPGKY
jgi:hypothetical protein